MTAAGIDALSDGRCILGLGASGPQVIEGFHGVPYDKPLGRTREIIDICRQVWRREKRRARRRQLPRSRSPRGRAPGSASRSSSSTTRVRSEIPIYVASLGPKNVEMTAELADGWLPLFYLPEKAKDVWGADLAAGAAKRSADLGPLEIVAGGLLSVGDGAEAVREFARPMVALYVGGMGAKGKNFYNDLVCRYGFEKEAEADPGPLPRRQEGRGRRLVPDELLEATTLCGPEGYVKERLAAFKESRRHRPQRHAGRPRPGQARRAGQGLDRGSLEAAMEPFEVVVEPSEIADLRDRLARTRWPERETVDGWGQGIPLEYTKELCGYWADGYDFGFADRINALPAGPHRDRRSRHPPAPRPVARA